MATLTPTAEDDRIIALDVLRGFALFGVMLVNYELWFRTSPLRYMQNGSPFPGRANQIVDVLLPIFFEGRFMGLFAFLFGAGLAVQAERVAARGTGARTFLLRRLGVLFAFGLLHILLLWSGDILHIYAIVGGVLVGLVLARRPRTILVAILAFATFPLVVAMIVSLVRAGHRVSTVDPVADAALAAHVDAVVRTMQQGSWLDIARARLVEYADFVPSRLLAAGSSLLMASLGVVAWKTRILARPGEHRRLMKWLVAAGLTLGLGQAAAHVALVRLPGLAGHDGLRRMVANGALLGQMATVLAYASGLVLLLHRSTTRPLLVWLAAPGRMALSNYLLQSLIGSWLFFGFGLGLYDRLGPAAAALIVVGVYLLQVAVSHLWLQRFRFGPVEWLWRSLSYGRAQPMTRARPALPVI